MTRRLLVLAIVVALVVTALGAGAALAKKGGSLYLYEKDPGTWEIIVDGGA